MRGCIFGLTLFSLGLRSLRHTSLLTSLRIRPGWLFIGSFFCLIILGTLLLKLPRAVAPGNHLNWLDALFTSTSAVCVTGLAVENTAHFFSPVGQVIILGLIQVGGLGIMTLALFLSSIVFRGMTLYDRQALGEMISERHLANVSSSLRFTVIFTFIAEALGALSLFLSLPATIPAQDRLFHAIFHSVSAFCNAGFSTLPDGLADSLVRDNITLQNSICLLIVFGGLGSTVVRDLLIYTGARVTRRIDPSRPRPRLRVHTRLVMTVTLLLIFGGAAIIALSEFGLYSGPSNGGFITTTFFHSITARTAGFNTVDMGSIGPLTIHFLVLLMLIGGSPGGTAGGVRTTVFAAATIHLWNLLRTVPQLILFRRRMPEDLGSRALAILVATMAWLFVNFAILRQLQPHTSDTELVFELVSAFATVGLSLNLTPELTAPAKVIIILNMFVGRIGLLTVLTTLVPVNRKRPMQCPTEEVLLS